MDSDHADTTIDDEYSVTIPPAVRSELDLEPGDRLEWTVEGGRLVAEVVHERFIEFDEFDPDEDVEDVDDADDADAKDDRADEL
ncbi:AbrB/MazE/SpoVT family DNA-binding domain-containing protein [Halobacteria archaeon AArc-m2/3/4]|uniref:AbrB/MazE/SpoVT family DNA-binding domain-containing protein n=1 Tax=Natronoglomus mannanivorans TaxID=2979990 RepID=A0ABT2QDX1_9EURY|nr:AbrB/MazE/SpoVT family DNA-binding domain-containing protein [Halobacteria archaeon AArc-m2/3/4]